MVTAGSTAAGFNLARLLVRSARAYPHQPALALGDAVTATYLQLADRVARMNVETGEWNFYLLPFEANIRDINLQPAARDGLSGLWIGHTHQAMITLVEPLAR